MKLLPSHPSLSLVTALLHTLTRLSLKTLVHISDQVRRVCMCVSACMYVTSTCSLSYTKKSFSKVFSYFYIQVKLLLCYAQGDGRKAIRYRALLELRAIASQVPHMWTQDMIQVTATYHSYCIDTRAAPPPFTLTLC